jgi:hypothetical protein
LPKHSNKDARSQENVFSGQAVTILLINLCSTFEDGCRGFLMGYSLTKQYQSDRISRLPRRYVSSVLDGFACALIAVFFIRLERLSLKYPFNIVQGELLQRIFVLRCYCFAFFSGASSTTGSLSP